MELKELEVISPNLKSTYRKGIEGFKKDLIKIRNSLVTALVGETREVNPYENNSYYVSYTEMNMRLQRKNKIVREKTMYGILDFLVTTGTPKKKYLRNEYNFKNSIRTIDKLIRETIDELDKILKFIDSRHLDTATIKKYQEK